MNNVYLQHHGILGQKWGVRRYQNEDGSYKPGAEGRYNSDVEGAKARYKEAKVARKKAIRNYNFRPNSKNEKKAINSVELERLAKKDISSEKIKQKLNSEKKTKSNKRLSYENEYLKKGMSKEEAAIAAYKRERTEKILKVTAGLTVAAATAYVGYKLYDKNVDRYIKNVSLKRVTRDNDYGVHDAFYAAMNKHDEKRYIGLYGNQLGMSGAKVYQKTISVKNGLKVASERSAKKGINTLLDNDADYRTELIKEFKRFQQTPNTPKQDKVLRKAIKQLTDGKPANQSVYDALNMSLADHNATTTKKFYKHLTSNGYNSIIDVNDKKLSGYFAQKPIIVFDNKDAKVEKVRQLGEKEIQSTFKKELFKMSAKSLIAPVAAVAGAKVATNISNSKKDSQIVEQYRREHPDTKLSYNEILKNHYSE